MNRKTDGIHMRTRNGTMDPRPISTTHRNGHAVIAAGLLGVVLLAGCLPGKAGGGSGNASPTPSTDTSPSAEKGAREARTSIAAGHLKFREWPPMPYPAAYQEYVALLRERCHVEYEVSGPPAGVAEADFRKEVTAWNMVMNAEIERRFGADILVRLHADAQKIWKEEGSRNSGR